MLQKIVNMVDLICNNGDGKTAASGSDRLPEHRVS